ncbi:hypothetical protein [Spirillospora sp. NPDC047279]|uniref:hypothetical protein n=1 Tax=Spirillospora sp. NPDC047279 TaxID=3155478 RepID=UPI00340E81B3
MRSRIAGALATAVLAGMVTPAPAVAATTARPYDFDGDGHRDLVAGSPDGTVAGKRAAGFVSVVPGSRSGLATGRTKVISQNSPGVPGAAEAGDRFGAGLGAITLVRGAATGLTASGAMAANARTLGVQARNAHLGTLLPH